MGGEFEYSSAVEAKRGHEGRSQTGIHIQYLFICWVIIGVGGQWNIEFVMEDI